MSITSIARPAWVLTRELCLAPAALALVASALLVDVLARTLLPLGIASSATRGTDVSAELRQLLFVGIALLLLVRVAHWGMAFRCLSGTEKWCIVIVSGLYLHLLVAILLAIPDRLLFRTPLEPAGRILSESLWLTCLAGILAQSRLDARNLGLLFLLLAWFVPTLCMPLPAEPFAAAKGLPLAAWSAEGFLSMLVPQLLALGYVSVEDAQR
jgi:hypothetical protein